MSEYAKLVASVTEEDILNKWQVTPLKNISGIPTSASSDELDKDDALNGHDQEQIRLMDELCIVLDNDDRPVGAATKKECHLLSNINAGLLHRAFSVFLFNEDGKLLLQQRADEKITFPGMWTNTCCSHPLCIPSELGITGAEGGESTAGVSSKEIYKLSNAVHGAKVAAQRKLDHELGIAPHDSPVEKFQYLTRIHYKSASADSVKWGEHEIDYILILRAQNNVGIKANLNEVKDFKYVDAEELKQMFEDESLVFTPWFKLICQTFLFKWWGSLDRLEEFKDDEIHRLL